MVRIGVVADGQFTVKVAGTTVLDIAPEAMNDIYENALPNRMSNKLK